jgi:hypothetical protein
VTSVGIDVGKTFRSVVCRSGTDGESAEAIQQARDIRRRCGLGRKQRAAKPAVCYEKRRELAVQFAIAASLYAESVALLTRDGGLIPPEEYDRLRKEAEEGRLRAEEAGISFEEHVESQRCHGGNS